MRFVEHDAVLRYDALLNLSARYDSAAGSIR